MTDMHRDPTADSILEMQVRKRGPSICKKNLRRDPRFPLECSCNLGLVWPKCRWPSAGLRNSGFEVADV